MSVQDLTTILVYDRDPSSRRLYSAGLGDGVRYRVLEAATVRAALEIVQREREIGLIVLDPAQGSQPAWETIPQLRAAAPRIPILVVSVLHSGANVARALELGAHDFLFKPVEMNELRHTVQTLLKRKTSDRCTVVEKADEQRHTVQIRCDEDGMVVDVVAPTGSVHVERFESFARRLLSKKLSKDEIMNLRLALEEVITNAREWGNRNDNSKLLRLSYCLLPDRVTFRIEDQGEGFKPEGVPDPTVNPLQHIQQRKAAGKRIGGWGIFLIRNAVDEVSFNEKGNVAFLTKYYGKSSRKSRRLSRVVPKRLD